MHMDWTVNIENRNGNGLTWTMTKVDPDFLWGGPLVDYKHLRMSKLEADNLVEEVRKHPTYADYNVFVRRG